MSQLSFADVFNMARETADIDPVAADMTFIQLSLLGIAAEVVTGNTLTMQFRRVRYTPCTISMTLKNGWLT